MKKLIALLLVLIVFPTLSYTESQDLAESILIKADSGELCHAITNEIELAGYNVAEVTNEDLPDELLKKKVDLLVISNAAALPFKAVDAIKHHIDNGGDVIALNTPLWEGCYEDWCKISKKAVPFSPSLIENTLYTPEDINQWVHSVSNGTIKPHKQLYHNLERVDEPIKTAVHVSIPTIDVWDTLDSPQIEKAFPNGNTLTVFYAKGGGNTNQFYVEWQEKDGSTWFATVPLEKEWRQYVLTPEDFYLLGWTLQPTTGENFKPENAVRLKVGLFRSHISNLNEGAKEYWIGEIGTASKKATDRMFSPYELPTFDILSPWYKFFDCHDVSKIIARQDQCIIDNVQFPIAEVIRSPHPRAMGNGFDKRRDWRWIPLLQAESASGQWRGTPAVLMINTAGKFKGSQWASFGISDANWYQSPQVLKSIGQLAKKMREGVFIVDGGSNYYTYFENQPMTVGMRVANLGRERQPGLTAQITISDPESNRELYKYKWQLDIDPGEEKIIQKTIEPNWAAGGLTVRAQLLRENNVIDTVENKAHTWRPKPLDKRSYITVRDGDFILQGERWRANGINYMPSSGIGTEDVDYMDRWLGWRAYDPEVICRDLKHIKELGLNSLSIFIDHKLLAAQNLLDFLRISDEMGFKIDLSLRPGTPMDFEWQKMKDLLEYYRISEHDCVFALDLAWEPEFGKHDERKRWDGDWVNWISERYGSVENAQSDWGISLPQEQGKITNPLNEQMACDGQWRKMVAAYRRFLDTLLYEKYNNAKRLVSSVDPHHLVSFRMSKAGDPTYHGCAYDWPYLGAAVDILEPEAYGRIGGWKTVRPGWFTFEYARYTAPQRPLFWAEVGYSIFDIALLDDTEQLFANQAGFFENFYKMMIKSSADGIFIWWYPGGYRVNERSDFGIINPDGTDRPVTRLLRSKAQEFLNGPSTKPIDNWIEIDRDKYTDGLFGIYANYSGEFWKAVESGKIPGLKTAATDSNSATCELKAVGNSNYNGNNPPKFLDGYFDSIEVKNAHGRWVNILKDDVVEVRSSEPVLARATVINLCEPVWLSPSRYDGKGAVYILIEIQGQKTLCPLPEDVPHFGRAVFNEIVLKPKGTDKDTAVTLTLTAKGRAIFGPKFAFKVIPVRN